MIYTVLHKVMAHFCGFVEALKVQRGCVNLGEVSKARSSFHLVYITFLRSKSLIPK